MTLIATAVALAMAAVLLWAALAKARNLAPAAATIRSLGLPRSIAWPGALFVTAAEIVVAVAVLFKPDSVLTHLGIVSLAVLFALAGLIALHREEPIYCGCFGAGGNSYLGRTQLIALLPWLVGAGILRVGIQETPPLQASASSFAAIALAIAVIWGIGVWKARLEARGDRRSATEMYAWLRSH